MSVQNQIYTRGKSEKWIKFLETILEGDQERIQYIQKLVGISLRGKADFQAVNFCLGDVGDGKSTFIETLRRLFGDYLGNITSETLLSIGSYSRNTSDYDMADLFSKRMVVGDELSRDREFNESHLKNLLEEMKSKQCNPERSSSTSIQPIPYGCLATTNQR